MSGYLCCPLNVFEKHLGGTEVTVSVDLRDIR